MVGRVDGLLGPRTEAAIFAFQRGNDLDATGKLDAATLAHLESHDAEPMQLGDRAKEGEADLGRAGDATVRNGRAISAVGKTAVVGGGLELLDQATGIVGHVGAWLNSFEPFRAVAERLNELSTWGMEHWRGVVTVALLIAGVSLVYYARDIIRARVEAHRNGSNLEF